MNETQTFLLILTGVIIFIGTSIWAVNKIYKR